MGQTKIEYDKTKGQSFFIPCARCNTSTVHLVSRSVDIEQGLFSINSYEHFQIVQCQGCLLFSFCKTSRLPSEDTTTALGPRLVTHRDLYPARVSGYKLIAQALLPTEVSRVYAETYKALSNDQPVLAGIGIRSLVEAVCKERGAPGKNLQQKIDGLVGLGLITGEGANLLHSLRFLGNRAAHTVTPHSPEKLSAAIKVVEHLLEAVYVMPKYGKQLSKP